MKRGALRICRLMATLPILAGCWISVPQPPEAARAATRRPAASLSVDETGFPWGGGKLGPSLAQSLVESGAFERVEYPLIPTARPPLAIRVLARADIDGHDVAGVALGLLQTPSYLGLIPYLEDWKLAADVEIELAGGGRLRVPVQEDVRVTHAFMASPFPIAERVREIFVRRIQQEIVQALDRSAPSGSLAPAGLPGSTPRLTWRPR